MLCVSRKLDVLSRSGGRLGLVCLSPRGTLAHLVSAHLFQAALPPSSQKSPASLWDENLKPTMQNLFEVSLSKKPQIKGSSAKQNIFLQSQVDVNQALHGPFPHYPLCELFVL